MRILLMMMAAPIFVLAQAPDTIQWKVKTVVRNIGPDSNSKYGAQYARMRRGRL